MGNKLETEKENSKFRTPQKSNKREISINTSSSELNLRQKDGLYSEEKLFEDFESNQIT